MLYRKIPKTGDELSILGFGCMRLPTTKDGRIDESRATRQVREAIDRGVNYLDTAWPYHAGESENFLDEKNQAGSEGLQYAADRDLGVVVMEPLRGGNLGLATPPRDVEAIFKEAKNPRTPVEWALRWIWHHPEVTVVLSGMNEEDHIKENLAIAAEALPNSLTKDELNLVDAAGRKYRELMKVGCTGCGYCMPCPSDVAIPRCFEVYNKLHMFGNEAEAKFSYAIGMSGVFGGTPSYASQCVQCGDCLEKCPQHIEIPDFLEIVAEEIEDAGLEQRIAVAKKMLNME